MGTPGSNARALARTAGDVAAMLIVVLLLLTGCTSTGQPVDPSPTADADPVCEREPSRAGTGTPTLQAVLDDAVSEIPGGLVLALGRRGEPVRYCAAGRADTAGTPLRPDDAFRVASITKTFTAVMVLQLVDEGLLALDTPVDAALPGVPLASGVSVRHLLSHTSGIPDFFSDEFLEALTTDWDKTWTASEVVATLDGRQRVFEPGTGYLYSNTNFLLAAILLEAATGQSFAENLRIRILEPLELEDTVLGGGSETAVTGFAPFFAPGGNTEGVSYRALATAAGAAGGLVSTAPDLVTFYRALADDQLLPPALLDEMTTFAGLDFYGLGLQLMRLPSGSGFGHGGELPGYLTFAAVRPESDDVVMILTNTMDRPPQSFLPEIFAAW